MAQSYFNGRYLSSLQGLTPIRLSLGREAPDDFVDGFFVDRLPSRLVSSKLDIDEAFRSARLDVTEAQLDPLYEERAKDRVQIPV